MNHAIIMDHIYIYENTSYELLKKMQTSSCAREVFEEKNRKLLAVIVTLTEKFIVDLQEVANRTLAMSEFQKRYDPWVRQINKHFLALSEGEIAPDDLQEWSDQIVELAGWVLDSIDVGIRK